MTDFRYMYKTQLLDFVKKRADTANKRMYRLEKEGFQNYSFPYQKRGGQRFKAPTSTASMEEIRMFAFEVEKFIEAKTTSVGGIRKSIKQTNERLGVDMSADEAKAFWEMYDMILNSNYGLLNELTSTRIQQEIVSYTQDKNGKLTKRDFKKIKERIDEIVEENHQVELPEGYHYNEWGFLEKI